MRVKVALDRGALAREITRLADGRADIDGTAPRAMPIEPARRIAITGSPGAGKSTLSGRLACLRARGRRYGILAIDPSSPRSGGAILGDRIRIDELEGAAELYVRSLGSRSSNDGLADHLPDILDAMDRHGFDEVLVETVGVGQAEYAVHALVDTVVLVLHPESGDSIQAMKAGILEMADVIVVNKADLASAAKSVADLKRVLSLKRHAPGAWTPPILTTSAKDPDSIVALSDAIDAHRTWRDRTDTTTRDRLRDDYVLRRAVDARIADALGALPEAMRLQPLDAQVDWVLARTRAERPAG